MEDAAVKQGFFSKLFGNRQRFEDFEDDYIEETAPRAGLTINAVHRYQVSVRRQVLSFQDAVLAADGLKRGEQQILNLVVCHPELREKIKDFLFGVTYTSEGDMQEIGEHIFLFAPASAFVEIASPQNRSRAHATN